MKQPQPSNGRISCTTPAGICSKGSSKCFYLAIRISCSMEPSVVSMVWDLVIQRNKKRHLSIFALLPYLPVMAFCDTKKSSPQSGGYVKKSHLNIKLPLMNHTSPPFIVLVFFQLKNSGFGQKPWHLFCCDLHSWGFLSLRPEAKAHWCGFVEGSGFAWRGICKATWLHKNTVFFGTKRSEIWNVDSFSFASQADPGYSRYLAS